MKYFWLYLIALMALCMSCRSTKQVQLKQHVTEHTTDTAVYQNVTSSHASVDSTAISVGGRDIVVDIVETIEQYDTLGRIKQKHVKTTNIHHKDSVTEVKDSHKIFADTSHVGKLHGSHKDIDTDTKTKQKNTTGITVFGGISVLLLIVAILYFCHIASKIWKP